MTRMNTTGLAVAGLITATAAMICAAVIHRSDPWVIAYAAVSVICALAVVQAVHMRDELRAALVRLERATRPPGPAPVVNRAALHKLAEQVGVDCCDRWWSTAGAEHDPQHCTKKDHHA
ncbi:hypothetical protein ABZ890_39600 [Streptomyces sp. NPDC046984]|uniref:hypothetical protein n=1 Tax=Streptomyces sp. NPDC046984 TaxID=3155138 RepID=UPI0033D66F63